MLPFTSLWFHDPAQEAAFGEAYFLLYFQLMSRLFRFIRLVIVPVFLVTRYFELHFSWVGVATFVHGVGLVGLDCFNHVMGARLGSTARIRLTIFDRVTTVAGIFLDISSFKEPVTSPWSLVRFLGLNSGVVPLIMVTFGIPLLSRHHLAVQIPTMVVLGYVAAPRMCAVAISAPESGYYITTTWRVVHNLFTAAPMDLPAPEVAVCCRTLLVLEQVVVGLLVPSYALWATEYINRSRFRRSRLQHMTGRFVGLHCLLIGCYMGCLWLILNIRLWL
ncbi:unnamed protein product [Ostreobium quekettii]|uniref:Uncharacterized protein n=1 Tax=Ostreobium quekettii TaxID=121088 RepID=A0A8S1IK25_9CHLO|nr:unnamed protein product [Ostreobium quekettii]|eukprot:evm.model.scf_5.2 EVM.evm.TU.scf_5.2   scf_5:15951-16778(-)